MPEYKNPARDGPLTLMVLVEMGTHKKHTFLLDPKRENVRMVSVQIWVCRVRGSIFDLRIILLFLFAKSQHG